MLYFVFLCRRLLHRAMKEKLLDLIVVGIAESGLSLVITGVWVCAGLQEQKRLFRIAGA